MYIKQTLYTLRKKHHLSQEQLADLLGVSRQAVQKWEAGTSNPDIGNLIAISDYFGVTLDELVRGKADAESGASVAPGADIPSPDAGAQDGPAHGDKFSREDGQTIHVHLGRTRYEYKSRRTLFGLPLIHIHLGRGLCRAKGILAIGNIATGVLSLGLISAGVLAFGGIGFGLLALGGIAGGGVSVGGMSIGLIALGGAAFGLFAVGGGAVGMVAIGGGAAASHIAIGGGACGHIAIGEQVSGDITLITGGAVPLASEQVRAVIAQEYPHIWPPLLHLLSALFRP